MDNAPTPITPIETDTQDKPKPYEILEEKKFSIKKDNNTYILKLSKTNKDSILFNLKLDEDLNKIYYECNYTMKYLFDLSNVFRVCESLEDLYNFIVENMENNQNSIKIEFNNDKAKLEFFVIYFLVKKKKEEKIELNLMKKEININDILIKLNTRIINFQDNQNKYEIKIKEINELLNKRDKKEKELIYKIKEINIIKESQIKFEKYIKKIKIKLMKF